MSGTPHPSCVHECPWFYAFDLLLLDDGRSLLHVPYDERRQLDELETDGLRPDPAVVLGRHRRPAARHRPPARSRGCRRETPRQPLRARTASAGLAENRTVAQAGGAGIGGWTVGEGRRARTFGSLLLGAHDENGGLRYLGHVGTGFSDAQLDQLMARLRPLTRPTSPFDENVPREHARHARWAEPVLVGEVEYRVITRDASATRPGRACGRTVHRTRSSFRRPDAGRRPPSGARMRLATLHSVRRAPWRDRTRWDAAVIRGAMLAEDAVRLGRWA